MLGEAVVNLDEIEYGRRALAWDGALRSTFPGLSVSIAAVEPQLGSLNRIAVGAGELCAIESAPARVSYRPNSEIGTLPYLSLMVQARGSSIVRQNGQLATVNSGDMCLLDEGHGFTLESRENTSFQFLRLPRAAALGRHPQLEQLFARTLPGADTGTRMLGDTLLRLSAEADRLGSLQRAAILSSMIHMLGVAEPFSALPETANWRIRRALDFIELNLSVHGLSAEDVARDQHISRRRLDQLMLEAVGHSITSQIWNRRLELAAADLRDPGKSALPVAQIAFANGFEDPAHFTRAFKRRYDRTPGQWRLN